ncbi:MAG: hypothetical protein V3V33_02480 [Candidatus Lokiarchaeia archaeon]
MPACQVGGPGSIPGGRIFFDFNLKGIFFLEEIKRLYEKLHSASEEEREKLWKIIIEKNRILFDKKKEELRNALGELS